MNFTVASAPLAALRGRLHLQRWNSSPHTCRPSAACVSAVEGVQRLCCHSTRLSRLESSRPKQLRGLRPTGTRRRAP